MSSNNYIIIIIIAFVNAGSISAVFISVNASQGPDGNYMHSYLTIVSYPGLMFGIINIVGMCIATVD